jgi:hypothetical protein
LIKPLLKVSESYNGGGTLLNWIILTTLTLLMACGEANYKKLLGNDPQQPTSQKPQGQNNPKPSGTPLCCEAAQPAPDSEKEADARADVTPPVPVVGSYLAARVTDANGIAVASAEVVLKEAEQPLVKAISNAAGLVTLPVVAPRRVEQILVRRRIGTSISESSLSLSSGDQDVASRATYSREKSEDRMQTLLEMRAGDHGSTLSLRSIRNAEIEARSSETDTRPPQLNEINTSPSGANQKIISINASDSESGLHWAAYSFDAGRTWSSSNQTTATTGTTLTAGQIQVRDRAGNIARTTFNLTL